MSALRKWLFTGLLVIVPGVITIAVLNWIVGTLDQTLQILPGAWHPDKLLGFHIPGFGVLLTLLILLVVGATASNFAGRKLVQWGDRLVSRIPVALHLLKRQAGLRHAVFRKRQRLSHRRAGAMAPRRGLDRRLHHRHSRW